MTWSQRSTRSNRGRAWMQTRTLVLDRDGWRCRIQGQRCAQWASEVDHIINKATVDNDHPSNLQAVCTPCHKEKTQREAHEARAKRNEAPKHPGLL